MTDLHGSQSRYVLVLRNWPNAASIGARKTRELLSAFNDATYVRVTHERVSAMDKQQRFIFSVTFTATLLASCVINPVTGDRELALVSPEQEIAIGEQQYEPSQQMQGGE